MIHRTGHKVSIECDGCDDVIEDRDSFNEAWSTAKNDGWKAEQVGGEWVHLCPRCQKRGRK